MSGLAADTPRTRAGLGVALFVVTVLLFARAWQHDFVNYDDPDYVTANPHVLAGLSLEGIGWALRSGEASNWHPLTWMSHMLDVSLFGRSPRGHHATSVVLHSLNAVLAFGALRRLTGALWTSALAAALFAWHPLRVESVAWVAERKDVLSGLFWFLTLWAYAVYAERRRTGLGGAGRFYATALVACALGLMAKPMLVTLPCVLLLLDVWPLRRAGWPDGAPGQAGGVPAAKLETLGRLVGEKVPFFALAAASSWVTYFVQKGGGSVSMALSLEARLANAVFAVVRYIGKLVAPVDLAVLYPHPGDWPTRKVAASLVIVAGLTAIAWWQRRRRPWVLIGWLWFLGTLVPVIGLVQVGLQSMADRYTYLPVIGVEMAVLWTLRDVLTSPAARRTGALVAAAVLAGLAARTWQQLAVWRNSFTLFDHTIAVTENNYLAHNNRGIFLCDAGRVEEGIADYRRALAIKPDYPEANNNLGRQLVQQGRAVEAVALLRRAVQAKPDALEVRNNLANALADAGAVDEAIEHYGWILQRQPRHANALNGLGVALAMKGRAAEAKTRLEEALRIAPDNAGAHANLGNVCSMLGQLGDAAEHYRRALALQPDAQTHAQLGFTLASLGRREEAIRELRAALQLRPDLAQARAWLEAVMAQPAAR